MKRKKIIIFIIITLVFIIGCFILNKKEVLKEEKSLISKQSELEQNFKIDGYTLDNPNIIIDPYNNSPLTALVIFKTDDNVSPVVTIKGKDKNTTYVNKFKKSKIHYLPILGLYADTKNEITIEIDGTKKTVFIKTDKLPDNLVLPTYVYSDKSKLDNELYFFTPSSDGPVCAYDINGDVRWYLESKASWKIDKLDNGNMLLSTEKVVNPPYYTTGLYEIDMLGKIHNEYLLNGGYHHDYYELESGNLLVLSNDFKTGTVEDVIVEIDRKTGKIIKSIDLKNILNTEDGKSEDWKSYDWFHNNSIWYDKKTNSITLSGRHQDAIINIDYETEKLNWILGDKTNWSKKYEKYFFTPIGNSEFEWQWAQHAAMITPSKDIFVLDNGNNKSKIKEDYVDATDSYTRGVIYDINTEDMTIKQVWEYGKDRGSEFYSPYISDVDYLDKNHYIVHSGGIVYVDGKVSNTPAGVTNADKLVSDTVELLNDEIIFEIKLPTNNYRVEKMNLYDDHEFKLGSANSLGTIGKTDYDKSGYKIFYNFSDIDKEYKNKEIEIKKEENRLVVNGKFNKEDNVSVILSKCGQYKKYDIRISTRPYTALCIDIFTEKNLNVYKYINEDGLSGNYNIYVELNGKIYNTTKKVSYK